MELPYPQWKASLSSEARTASLPASRALSSHCQVLVTVNEVPLQHGRYESVRVAWGKVTILGNEMMVVATDDANGKSKVSMKIIGDALDP